MRLYKANVGMFQHEDRKFYTFESKKLHRQ